MATYAIGDIQGCFHELQDLLALIGFSRKDDQLWFCGDLVNRGPDSMDTLRFIHSLGDRAITVLGNHDLHLLAIAFTTAKQSRKDTLNSILNAPDRDEILHWLRHRVLFHEDKQRGYALVHAGVAPQWNMKTIHSLANEVHEQLRGPNFHDYLGAIYGNKPAVWSEDLRGAERLRCITNYFTRLRYCDKNGVINFKEKNAPGTQSAPSQPWYSFSNRKSRKTKIIFGHWSTHYLTYPEVTDPNNTKHQVFPLDTGCLWGGRLTAFRLEDKHVFSVASRTQKKSARTVNNS